MLRKLSVKNAKRQARHYVFFFAAIVSSAALMFAFNSLMFSETVNNLQELQIMPFMIIAASILVVFILGYLVNYMTSFILKKRSKELSIYMVLGIPNQKISRMFMTESFLMGTAAMGIGIFFGILISKLLEAVIFSLVGVDYTVGVSFSGRAVLLTVVYFLLIYLFALIRNTRYIKNTELYDLLYLEKQNDTIKSGGTVLRVIMFVLACCAGTAGIGLFLVRPWGKGVDILLGLILIVCFLFGFFSGISVMLVKFIQKREDWKYRNNRMVLFRTLTSNLNAVRYTLGILSILFTLALLAMGVTMAMNKMSDRGIEQSVFDIAVIHRGPADEAEDYLQLFGEISELKSSHIYNLYTGDSTQVKDIRKKAILAYKGEYQEDYREFKKDTYMGYSDYVILCDMLGYEPPVLDDDGYLVQTIAGMEPWLEEELAGQYLDLECTSLEYRGAITYEFNQHDPYGNGLGYIIVIPDSHVSSLPVLYSLQVGLTEQLINSSQLKSIAAKDDRLEVIGRTSIMGTDEGGVTMLDQEDKDYITGKWEMKENFFQLYSMMVALVYVGIVFEITGLAILATQLLSNSISEKNRLDMLFKLGMKSEAVNKLINKQLFFMFLLPGLPAFLISTVLTYISTAGMSIAQNDLPAAWGTGWIGVSILQAAGVFLLIYAAYSFIVVRSYKRNCGMYENIYKS